MQNVSVVKKSVHFGISISLSLLTQQAYSAESEASQSDVDVSTGKTIYIKKGCDVCHGYVGQGWLGAKRLAEPVLPLASFMALVRRPNGSMPPYSPKVLSDDDLEDIHEYLASLKSPDVKDIPLLKRDD